MDGVGVGGSPAGAGLRLLVCVGVAEASVTFPSRCSVFADEIQAGGYGAAREMSKPRGAPRPKADLCL